jgi:hypothetical protein
MFEVWLTTMIAVSIVGVGLWLLSRWHGKQKAGKS